MSTDLSSLESACDEILAVLRAAEVQVERLAAKHLSPRGALRVHRLAAQHRADILLGLNLPDELVLAPVASERPTVRIAPQRLAPPVVDYGDAPSPLLFDEAPRGDDELELSYDDGPTLGDDAELLDLSDEEDDAATVSLSPHQLDAFTRELEEATPQRAFSSADLRAISEEDGELSLTEDDGGERGLSFADEAGAPSARAASDGLVSFSDGDEDGLVSFSDDAGGDGLVSFSDDEGGDGLVSFSDGDEDGLVSFSDDEGGDGLVSFSDDDGGDGLVSFSDDGGGDGLVSFSDGDEDGLVSFSDDAGGDGLMSFSDDAGGDGLMSFSDDAGGDGLMSFSDDAGGDGLVSFSDGDEDGLVSFSDGDAEGLVSFADGDASEGPDSLAEDRLVSFPAEEEPLFDEGELESLAGDGLVDLEDEDVAPPTEEVETRAAPSPRLFTEGELAYGEDPLLSGPPAVHAQVVDAADGPHLFDQGELIQLNAAVVSDEDPASGPFKEPDFFRHLEQSAAQDERPVVEFDEEDDEEELAFDDNEDLSFSDDEADPALSEPVDPLAALSSLVSDLKPEPTPGRASVRPRLPPRPEPGLGDSDLRAGPRAVAAVPAGGGVSYGTVPTIRDFDQSTPKPAAAAIQLNADQSGGVILGMEEEILELGDASDFDEEYDEDDSSSGFRLELEEYEEDDDFEEEEEEDEEQRSAVPAVVVPAVQQLSSTEVAKRLAKAIEARDSGEMDRSIDLYSDVLDAEPDNTEAHLGRGRVYLDMGDYSRAMSDFTVAEELEPESADPRVGMGDFFFARKEYRKAIEFFDEALQISPDHAMALCRRGISYYYRRDYHAAVADLTKAMKLNPDIPNISTYLSTAKRKQKK